MEILDMLDKQGEAPKLFDEHPVKLLNIEEQLLYLYLLAFIMNASGDIDAKQKNYLLLLIHSFELDISIMEEMICFCQQPEQEIIDEFYKLFKGHKNRINFLFDALIMCSKLAKTQHRINKKQKRAINKISINLMINNRKIRELDELLPTVTSTNNDKIKAVLRSKLFAESQFEYLAKLYDFNIKLIVGRYWDGGDGTIIDKTTSLQWQRFLVGQRWENNTCKGKAHKYRWKDAIKFAKNDTYAGRTDWRLPTIEELKTLVYSSTGLPKTWNDTGKKCEGDFQLPTIYLEAFPNVQASAVWSSSLNADASNDAWGVNFYNGSTGSDFRGNSYQVRLVRSGQRF